VGFVLRRRSRLGGEPPPGIRKVAIFEIVQNNQRGKPLPVGGWASVTMPTLVMDGGKSPAWMRHANRSLAAVLPNAQYRTLAGQTYVVKAKAHTPALVEFFKD